VANQLRNAVVGGGETVDKAFLMSVAALEPEVFSRWRKYESAKEAGGVDETELRRMLLDLGD